ncbi:MAG TPA: hypothetical protein VFR47_17740 [Anaerolineales bacterium]|nr:hypothetical protein [Anaerolineales bacterium]
MDVRYTEASIKTADNLKTIAASQLLRDLSRLSLPEIEAATNLISQVVPAGNIPGVILSGLARLAGHQPPLKTVKRDIDLLFQSVEQVLDGAVYAAFFAGPAAVIWGYQNLLKLAGKDPEASFPEGTWQFYVNYALREDTARHANETHGFDTLLTQHHINLAPVDRVTAWVMAAIHCLHQFHDLLADEWRERVYLALLREATTGLPEASRFANLYRAWELQRPYGRGQDAGPEETYPAYRRAKFDKFLAEALRDLPEEVRRSWKSKARLAETEDLPAYQRQMSILAYLEPGAYGETRVPIPVRQTHIGVIYQGHYYFMPVCASATDQPVDVTVVRAQISSLITSSAGANPAQLSQLARVKRTAIPTLRGKLTPALNEELNLLRSAPILLNCDPRSRALPLSELRQTERGIGDHALTIFDTGETFVFDQSHIFFDGAWGAALAEILTNEALSWAVYLHSLPPAQPAKQILYGAPSFHVQPSDSDLISKAPHITLEAGAESDEVNLNAILNLRKFFKQRSDLLQLTVNDLLVLYRAIHAVIYKPDAKLVAELKALVGDNTTRAAAKAALEEIESERRSNPAILIPMDASQHSPRERLYPMSFEVPLKDLDFLQLHAQTLHALAAYETGSGDRASLYEEFDRLQRTYLAALAGFGAVMARAKEIAILGKSTSVGSIKLLAHMPTPLQRLLDNIPGQFDVLNDMIKGREVFSNVGAVAKTSTLTRFITAKDDNDKKTLAWGVITDARGVMRVTLRDFRRHVGMLEAVGQRDLACRLTQDYLAAYVRGLNQYVLDLRRMTISRRATRFDKKESHS